MRREPRKSMPSRRSEAALGPRASRPLFLAALPVAALYEAGEALRIERPHLRIDLSQHRFAVKCIEHLFGSDLAHVESRLPGHSGRVGADEDIVEFQQGVFAGRRLGRPHVKTGASQLLAPQSSASAASSWMWPRAVLMR